MLLISHRGNLNGPNPEKENSIPYIEEAISLGYDVEIDLWLVDEDLFLGHDSPQYKINLDWIITRKDLLWVHCKNIKAIEYLNGLEKNGINYFWHQSDEVTLTSMGFIWAYPGKQPISKSIAVLPELNNNEDLLSCYGVCSDYVKRMTDENSPSLNWTV
jgi:hypothetical protein